MCKNDKSIDFPQIDDTNVGSQTLQWTSSG